MVVELPTGDVTPNPEQPRKHFDSAKLAELAASIGQHGLMQPITVRKANKAIRMRDQAFADEMAAKLTRLHDQRSRILNPTNRQTALF